MIVLKQFKKITKSILFALLLILTTKTYAIDEDYDYKFASTPFEYASLSSPNIKPNLIFLIDNSSFAVPYTFQAIVTGIINDPKIIANARAGLAYLYADTHPFISFEFPTRFFICVSQQMITSSSKIMAAGISSSVTITALLQTIIEQIPNIGTTCAQELQHTDLNIHFNSQIFTKEVKINDLNLNVTEINQSLAEALLNHNILLGLPVITRRYYEITREIRGLKPANSFFRSLYWG